ncbi:beta strand repeat-containing protein, partial [Fusobacterium varium]|uniref:beta strand repeat-containing protein n=1 Tax=Fusobacterium varium TaxID=856 RepID=UPI003565CF38
PTAPAGVSVTVTTPSAVEKITVTAPTITTPIVPIDKTITVAAPIAPDGYTPSVIPVPNKPATPATPAISVLVPLNLTFNGTGFGQPTTVSMPRSNIIAQNYASYDTGGATLNITSGTGGTSWSGATMTVAGGSTLTPSNTGSNLNAFISDVLNHDAVINGSYNMTRDDGGNGTIMFLSLNPYEVGRGGTTINRTYTFAGTLTLNGHNNPSSAKSLVGFEHQLLRGGGGGGEFSTSSTSILENTGTIILNSGYNMVGIMIDTEYNESAIAGSAFTTQPQTKNSGNIIINGKQSIGIDYGYYYSARPNSIVSLGNITINGEDNYGFRMKNYFSSNNFYYDSTNITGSNGTITVAGKKNIGIAIAQGTSSGDPISRVTGLNILVNGEENVGFFRNVTTATNTNDMVLNNTTINSLNFGANAKKSTLVRSDQNAVQLNKNITVTSGLTGNSFAQASGTGTIKNTAILQSNLNEFTGLIANGSGASITNSGTIEITGNNNKNIGLATVSNGVGSNNGTVKVLGTGNNKSGIYNTGTFAISNGSNIEVTGESSSGIYNSNTVNISGTVALKGTGGTTGIYSDGGTTTSTSGNTLTISIDDTSNPATKGLAIYAEGAATVTLGAAKIEVKEGAAGVAAFGAGTNISLIGSELKYSGEGYAAYSDGNGTINLTNASLELSGKATGVELDLLAPKVTLNGTTITMMSNDATVANLKNATGLLSNSLKATVETNLGAGVTIVDGTSGLITFDKYKIATVDGGDLTIDANMDKYSQNDTTTGYFYSRRFLGQRLDLTVDTGITVTSSTDTAYATTYFNNQVVGLEMNSSVSAASATDAQINLLTNSKVIADRTDSGNGAIGLYINFGKIDIAVGAEVEVEKVTGGGNTVNDKAVGVYAVNGSTVLNAGDIKVGGNQSIGILGMAYREQPVGTPIVDEFGTVGIFTAQGKADITNTNKITLDGTGAVGIYAY